MTGSPAPEAAGGGDAGTGPAAPRLGGLGRLHALRQAAVAALSLGFGITVALALWREVRTDAVEITPLNVPAHLVQEGFTPEVAARRLADQIDRAARAARDEQARRQATELAGDAPDLSVPIAGLSLQGLVRLIREVFGVAHTQVGGEVTLVGGRLSLRLRVGGHGVIAEAGGFDPSDVEAMLRAAAPEVWRVVQPRIYAWHVAAALADQEEVRRRLGGLHKGRNAAGPTGATIDYLIGRSLLRQGEVGAALAAFERLVCARPDYAEGWSGLAAARLLSGRAGDALVAQGRAVLLRPRSAHDRALRAGMLLHLGQAEAALAEARTGLLHDRHSASARHVEGEALLRLGRVEEALGGVDSWDSRDEADMIQDCLSGGGLGCSRSSGADRHGVGADGAADHRPA